MLIGLTFAPSYQLQLPQSAHPLISAPPQSMPPQSMPPQSIPPQSIALQPIPPQSTPRQAATLQSMGPQLLQLLKHCWVPSLGGSSAAGRSVQSNAEDRDKFRRRWRSNSLAALQSLNRNRTNGKAALKPCSTTTRFTYCEQDSPRCQTRWAQANPLCGERYLW
jgi:hypothetical protein